MRIGRVRTRASFAALAATGRRARRGVVRITAVVGDPDDLPCLAFAVSKAVGPAVVRNRIRRRLRAAAAELGPVAGTYLVAVDPSGARLPYRQLRDDLAAALEAVGALAPVVAAP